MRFNEASYYLKGLEDRVINYFSKRRNGYTDLGTLEEAATTILNSDEFTKAGNHYSGVWPRDICFAARGIVLENNKEILGDLAESMIKTIDDTFYTIFMEDYGLAVPEEGLDTFPALVKILDESDRLNQNKGEITRLAKLFREKFFNDDKMVVDERGSSWFDSASYPRETYNTAMLLTALSSLEEKNIATTFSGIEDEIYDSFIDNYWNGDYFDEHSQSSMKACDANVVPLYFNLVNEKKAESIITELEELETHKGLRTRKKPLKFRETNPIWYLHRDYHSTIWPWNSFMYMNAALEYGFEEKARLEQEKIEQPLKQKGNFLEILNLNGKPYIKNLYASAEDFTAAAALWKEYSYKKTEN